MTSKNNKALPPKSEPKQHAKMSSARHRKSLQALNLAEREKDFNTYIRLAKEFLTTKPHDYPQSIIETIRKRLQQYEKGTSSKELEKRSLGEVRQFLTKADIAILDTCIPVSHRTQEALLASTDIPSLSLPPLSDIFLSKDKRLHARLCSSRQPEESLELFQLTIDENPSFTKLHTNYQHDTNREGSILIAEIHNEFMPIFFYSKSKSGRITDISFIPFPSVLRNGIHYGELIALHGDLDAVNSLKAYAMHLLKKANGVRYDTIFYGSMHRDASLCRANEDFLDWLKKVHRINVASFDKHAIQQYTKSLFLPDKTHPSLLSVIRGVQVAEDDNNQAHKCSIVMIREYDCAPHKLLKASYFADELIETESSNVFPSLRAKYKRNSLLISDNDPLCLSYSFNQPEKQLFPDENPQATIYPQPNKAIPSEVDLVIDIQGGETTLETNLLSILSQKYVDIKRIVIYVDSHSSCRIAKLAHEISAKWKLDQKIVLADSMRSLIDLLELTTTNRALFVNASVVLQSKNIVNSLLVLADRNSIFSSGCMLNRMQTSNSKEIYANSSAGLYPSLKDYTRQGMILLEEKNILSGLIPTTINVIANSPDLCIVNKEVLLAICRKHSGTSFIRNELLRAACLATLNSMYNVVTTQISAQYIASPTPNGTAYIDKSTSRLILESWPALERSLSLCEELPA